MEDKYWDKLSKLQPYSFWLVANGVSRVPDSAGNWLERHKVQELIEHADAEIAILQKTIQDMMLCFSMEEDECSWEVFDTQEALKKE